MQRKLRLLLFSAMAAQLFCGCVQVPTIQYPRFPDQAKRIEDPAKARVYLIRPAKDSNSGVSFVFYGNGTSASSSGPRVDPRQYPEQVAVPLLGIVPKNPRADSPWRLIGEVGKGSYICWEDPPQDLVLKKGEGKTNSFFTVNLAAGNVYYLRVSIPGFWKPKSTLEAISEEEGLALLKGCLPPDDYRNLTKK